LHFSASVIYLQNAYNEIMKTQFFPQTSSYPLSQSANTCKDVIHLHNKEIMSLNNQGENVHLKCLSGTIWMTLPGDPNDYFLQTNETLELSLPKKGQVLIQAMPEAMVCW
jgi:hypothetical protein